MISWRKLGWLLLVAALTGVVACEREQPTVEAWIGSHHLSFQVPPGWTHRVEGDAHLFRQRTAVLVVEDLGELVIANADEEASIYEWTREELAELGETVQRGIAEQTTFERQGRTFHVVDTWDRLTHNWRKRFVFVSNAGHRLVIYTRLGDWNLTRQPMKALLATIRFGDDEKGE